jgi:hypothetical protein
LRVRRLIEAEEGGEVIDEGPPPPAAAYDLGILFIHGMGEQARGDTITQMGDAVTEWLRRWLGNDRFRLQDATLANRVGVPTGTAPPSGTASPSTSGRANATVVLQRSNDPADAGQRWLLAESWWADAFRPATFGELAWWAIGVGPWLIAGQLAGVSERLFRSETGPARVAIDWLVFVLLFLAAALVAAVIAPLVLVLLIFSVIPIPVISGFAQGIARNLAGSFGDLLVFVRSPVRFAAMAERVRGDIEWLDSQCQRIMVVAHSQGSAVAWHAIRRTGQADRPKPADRRTRLALFLTFGQAFRKLKALHRLHTRVGGARQLEFAVLASLSTLTLLAAGLTGYAAFVTLVSAQGDVGEMAGDPRLMLTVMAIAVVVVGIIQWRLAKVAEANDRKAEELIVDDVRDVQKDLPGFRWLDLWASADPAPNGPLFSRPVDGVASYRIRNLASTGLDHSVYWSNATEFVSAVAFAAGSVAPNGPLGSEPIPGHLRQAAKVRDLRVSALASARVLAAAALAGALIGFRTVLPDIGDWAIGLLSWLPFVPESPEDWSGLVRGLLGAGVILAGAGASWWILVAGWNAVIATDVSRFHGRQDQLEWPPLAVVWTGVAAVLPTLATIAFTILRGDPTFLAVYLPLAALGLLVVVRLMRTTEPQLSDPVDAGTG